MRGIGIGISPGVRVSGGAANPWTRVADSSDSTLLAGNDSAVAVYDGTAYQYFGKLSGAWKLLWPDLTGGLLRGNTGGATQVKKASNGPSPFDAPYGIATQRLAGARAAGDTFTHTADCVIEFVVTTLPGSIYDALEFRRQDSSNSWRVMCWHNGNFQLFEMVAGVETSRAVAGGVLVSGHRVVIVAEGSTIRGYSNNVLRWTYSSALNFATATSGLYLYSAGGAISDVVAWPRQITGTAAALLDAAIA